MTGSVACDRGPWPGRGGRLTDAAGTGAAGVKDLRAGLLQPVHRGKRQLLRVRQSAQPGELRGQLPVFDNQSLDFAIKEETNLAERLEILFFGQLHHPPRHWIILDDLTQAKSA
jgi:hypothetical protein